MDKMGVYPNGEGKGYLYKSGTSLMNSNEPFDIDENKKKFHKLYEELNYWQLANRLGLVE